MKKIIIAFIFLSFEVFSNEKFEKFLKFANNENISVVYEDLSNDFVKKITKDTVITKDILDEAIFVSYLRIFSGSEKKESLVKAFEILRKNFKKTRLLYSKYAHFLLLSSRISKSKYSDLIDAKKYSKYALFYNKNDPIAHFVLGMLFKRSIFTFKENLTITSAINHFNQASKQNNYLAYISKLNLAELFLKVKRLEKAHEELENARLIFPNSRLNAKLKLNFSKGLFLF